MFWAPAIIRVCWQQQTEQPASPVVGSVDKAGRYFPVHVLPLPSASADQDYSYGRVGYVIVADSTAYLIERKALVMNVSLTDGLVNEHAVQRLDKPVLILLVVLVKVADEDFVFGYLGGHPFTSNYKTKRHASKTVAMTTK